MSEIINGKKVTLEQLNISKITIERCIEKGITIDTIYGTSLTELKYSLDIENVYLKELVNAVIDTIQTSQVTIEKNTQHSKPVYDNDEKIKLGEDLKKFGLNLTHRNYFYSAGYRNIESIKGLTLEELRKIRGIGPEAIVKLYEHDMINIKKDTKTVEEFVDVLSVYNISKRIAHLLWFCRGVRNIEQIKTITAKELLGTDNVLTRMDVNRIRYVFPYEIPQTKEKPLIYVGTLKPPRKEESNIQESKIITTPLSNLFLPVQLNSKLKKYGIISGEDLISADFAKLAVDAKLSDNQVNQLVRVVQDLKVNKELGFNYTLITVNDNLAFYVRWLNLVKSQSTEMDAYKKLIDRILGYCNYVVKILKQLNIEESLDTVNIEFVSGFKKRLGDLRCCDNVNKAAKELTTIMYILKSIIEQLNKHCENTYYTACCTEV